jgi:hypothetical protein
MAEGEQGRAAWTDKALDLLECRVDEGFEMVEARLDAQRSDLNVLMGKPHTAEVSNPETKLGRFRFADVLGFVSLCLIPVVVELIRRGG